jgi:hypothetical protein
LLSKDEARKIAADIAKLPELLQTPATLGAPQRIVAGATRLFRPAFLLNAHVVAPAAETDANKATSRSASYSLRRSHDRCKRRSVCHSATNPIRWKSSNRYSQQEKIEAGL